jgi:hypothetical protein
MLVDTGASVTILNQKFLNTIDPSLKPEILPVNIKMKTATGEISSFLDQIAVELKLGFISWDKVDNSFLRSPIISLISFPISAFLYLSVITGNSTSYHDSNQGQGNYHQSNSWARARQQQNGPQQ